MEDVFLCFDHLKDLKDGTRVFQLLNCTHIFIFLIDCFHVLGFKGWLLMCALCVVNPQGFVR